MTFGNNTDDDQEQDHDDLLFGPPEEPPRVPPWDQPGSQQLAHVPVSAAHMADCNSNQMMAIVQRLLDENQRLNSESGKRSRADRDEDEEGEPPAKLHIPEGYDEAWTNINHAARNTRPYSAP